MEWNHSRIMSTAEGGTAMVVHGEDGWDALAFGLDGGSSGTYTTRAAAIEAVEGILGDMVCCVGHLADDSDG